MADVTITLHDIVKFIELGKAKAELAFKAKHFGNSEAELKDTGNQLQALADKFAAAGMAIVMPNDKQISEYALELSKFSDSEIFEALKSKTGRAYELLSFRGALLKKNFDNRVNIAKMNLALARLAVVPRSKLQNAIRDGTLSQDISIEADQATKSLLSRLFSRMGLSVFIDNDIITDKPIAEIDGEKETQLVFGNNSVWVPAKSAERIIELSKKINQVSTKIQLRNAERQVKTFNDDEEQEFAQLQRDYLSLLKDKDLLLGHYYNEERELVIKTK